MRGDTKLKKYKYGAQIIFACIVGIFAAFVLISYPLLSNYFSEKHQSEVRSEYFEKIEKLDNTSLDNARLEAQKYNSLLQSGIGKNVGDNVTINYGKLLNINDDGIMGYVEIPAINVYLPVAHGTDAKTLEECVGHVLGSSLPIGGRGSHAILSGHSGLAGKVMFTDLGQLKTGDLVLLHILDETLAYKVEKLDTVLPSDISQLSIEPDRDELTLVTCTPIGVNTHRLLVHCVRTEYEEGTVEEERPEETAEPAASDWKKEYMRGVSIGIAVLALAVLIHIAVNRRRKSEEKI